jgi:hypothetical protein
VSACASVAIYLLKTVETKVSFLITIPIHLHSYFFHISSVASSAPFGQESGCGWYKKVKSVVVGPAALYLNLMKDFS